MREGMGARKSNEVASGESSTQAASPRVAYGPSPGILSWLRNKLSGKDTKAESETEANTQTTTQPQTQQPQTTTAPPTNQIGGEQTPAQPAPQAAEPQPQTPAPDQIPTLQTATFEEVLSYAVSHSDLNSLVSLATDKVLVAKGLCMSTTHSKTVACSQCQTEQSVELAESANVMRSPQWRTLMLSGRFHLFTCTQCQHPFVVQVDVLYSDFQRRIFMGCFPQQPPELYPDLEAKLRQTWQTVVLQEAPAKVRELFAGEEDQAWQRVRLVPDYPSLQEKVLIFEHDLDDRLIEAMKLSLWESIPRQGPEFLAELYLEAVSAHGDLRFVAVQTDGSLSPMRLEVSHHMYADFSNQRSHLAVLLPSLFGSTLQVSFQTILKERAA